MKVFYHSSDLDGKCSAAIVKRFFPNCECIGVNYDKPIDFSKITPQETVYMVDFTIDNVEDMLTLDEISDFYWIDHHRTGIELMDGYDIRGKREIGKAGCELTWEYLSDDPIPMAVHLLAMYDIWNHKNPNVLLFQHGMKTKEWHPHDYEWMTLLSSSNTWKRIVEDGKVISKYMETEAKTYTDFYSFDTTIDGYKCLAVNRGLINSNFVKSKWDNNKYDLILYFSYMNSGVWTYSLYTDKEGIDVGRIAENHGGGGHKQAAGFTSKKLIFAAD